MRALADDNDANSIYYAISNHTTAHPDSWIVALRLGAERKGQQHRSVDVHRGTVLGGSCRSSIQNNSAVNVLQKHEISVTPS